MPPGHSRIPSQTLRFWRLTLSQPVCVIRRFGSTQMAPGCNGRHGGRDRRFQALLQTICRALPGSAGPHRNDFRFSTRPSYLKPEFWKSSPKREPLIWQSSSPWPKREKRSFLSKLPQARTPKKPKRIIKKGRSKEAFDTAKRCWDSLENVKSRPLRRLW